MEEDATAYPVRFGDRHEKWTVAQATDFLTSFTNKENVNQCEQLWLTAKVIGISLDLRVINGQWMWAYASRAYSHNGKQIMKRWQKAIRRTAEIVFFQKGKHA